MMTSRMHSKGFPLKKNKKHLRKKIRMLNAVVIKEIIIIIIFDCYYFCNRIFFSKKTRDNFTLPISPILKLCIYRPLVLATN